MNCDSELTRGNLQKKSEETEKTKEKIEKKEETEKTVMTQAPLPDRKKVTKIIFRTTKRGRKFLFPAYQNYFKEKKFENSAMRNKCFFSRIFGI